MGPADIAERAARESYGKLLAILAARTRNVALAEDALSEAFAAALSTWPDRGCPDNPEAWLLATARRKLIDAARRAEIARATGGRILLALEETEEEMGAVQELPDRRLGLLFACAHPALEPGVRTALMLQTVLGLSAERIAAAFLVSPATMGQRLVRAKAKIKEAGVAFALPPREDWPERLPAVLEAIYAAYGEGWSDPLGVDPQRRDLGMEALWLAELLARLTPEEPEVWGLFALLLHLEARRPARRDAAGAYVPLDAQDTSLWRRDLIVNAERALHRAARFAQLGRFQLEAAIQSAHATRAWRGEADWSAIVQLYDALAALTGSDVARLNGVAARARVEGPAAGLAHLQALADRLALYQPYWALKAHLLTEAGDPKAAEAAFDRAIALERDPAVIAFLRARRGGHQRAGLGATDSKA
jgi:RNA polymerase sigma-70 factor (ECF subfamily)